MKVHWTSNPREVFEYGNEFGQVGFIIGESFADAYCEMLDLVGQREGYCDHGGDITDEQRWLDYAGEDGGEPCDCDLTDDGKWVWAVYWWMREASAPVRAFCVPE